MTMQRIADAWTVPADSSAPSARSE
jgi:hypothetical protein